MSEQQQCNLCGGDEWISSKPCPSCHKSGFMIKSGEPLTLDEYQARAADTMLPACEGLDYLLPGLVGEVGEMMSKIAKRVRGDYDIDPDGHLNALVESEIGDVLWFVAMITKAIHRDLEYIAQANLDKLADRKERGVIKGAGDER